MANMNKHEQTIITNTPVIYNTISLLHTDVNETQYILFNMFRILRSARHKFNLTINELIILSGIVIYCKCIGTSFSYSAIVKHVKYFNDSKMRYYIRSLAGKGYIIQSDINGSLIRYKPTIDAINVMNEIQENYIKEFNRFVSLYGISL